MRGKEEAADERGADAEERSSLQMRRALRTCRPSFARWYP